MPRRLPATPAPSPPTINPIASPPAPAPRPPTINPLRSPPVPAPTPPTMMPETSSPAPTPSAATPIPLSRSVAEIPAPTWIPRTLRPPVSGTPIAMPLMSPSPPSLGLQIVALIPFTFRRRVSRKLSRTPVHSRESPMLSPVRLAPILSARSPPSLRCASVTRAEPRRSNRSVKRTVHSDTPTRRRVAAPESIRARAETTGRRCGGGATARDEERRTEFSTT